MTPHDRAAAPRDWARGLLPAEADVELIVNAVGGRLHDGPWVRQDDHGRVICLDPDVAAAHSVSLSGGEHRVLAIATSLLNDDHPVDLGDAMTGPDPDAQGHVLTALRRAGGAVAKSDDPAAPIVHRDDDGTARVLWRGHRNSPACPSFESHPKQ